MSIRVILHKTGYHVSSKGITRCLGSDVPTGRKVEHIPWSQVKAITTQQSLNAIWCELWTGTTFTVVLHPTDSASLMHVFDSLQATFLVAVSPAMQ